MLMFTMFKQAIGNALTIAVLRTELKLLQIEVDVLRKGQADRDCHHAAAEAIASNVSDIRTALKAGHVGNREESTLEAACRVVAERDDAMRELGAARSDRDEMSKRLNEIAAVVDKRARMLGEVRAALDPSGLYPAMTLDVLAAKVRKERDDAVAATRAA